MEFKRGKSGDFRRCKDANGISSKEIAQVEVLREYLPANTIELMEKDKELQKQETKLGRPTVYRSWMDEFAINYLAEGHTKESMCAVLGITKDTLWRWEKREKTFSESVKIGVLKAQKWWEDKSRDLFAEGNFIPPTYAMIMSNRFGYRNATAKIEHDENIVNVNHNIDEKRVTINYESAPDEDFAEILDVLLESGAVETEAKEITDSKAD